MIAADFWGVKASGRCNTAYNLRVLRSLLMTVHSRLLDADGGQVAFILKLAKAPVRPIVACVKFSTNNTFAATVSQKQI